MGNKNENHPIALQQFHVAEGFWKEKMELVRTSVIPYQWEILNDRIEGAAPSYCMHNFKTAAKLQKMKREHPDEYQEPIYHFKGGFSAPEDPTMLKDEFYGCYWQDTDFSKWIEAVAYSLVTHPDPELEKVADEAIDIVCAAQHESGYLDTHYIIFGMDRHFSCLQDHHELYCFGHLTEGAVAYYQATGKEKLLKAAMKFADYIDNCFGPEENKKKGYPGHEIAEMALVRLYEATGEERYLKLGKYFIDERGKQPNYWNVCEKNGKKAGWNYQYYQAHIPVREQDEAVGHAVRAMYLYSGIADIARLTDDKELRNALDKLWNSAVREKMYITGGMGATAVGEAFSYPFDLPNDLAYAETCAAIALVFWARRMLEMDPKAEYADVMERALYNSVISGMSLDGKSFFYVNPLEVLPEASAKDARREHVTPVRPKWFSCACCPPNLARLVSSVPAYAYTETEDTLYMHLYLAGDITKQLNDRTASFQVESEVPWNGTVSILYTGTASADMKLAVRIPGWCQSWTVKGNDAFTCTEENGYYILQGCFTPGLRIVFDFVMEPCFYQADDRVREDIGKLALVKGPIVYCAEEADNRKDLHKYVILPEEPVATGSVRIANQDLPALIVHAKQKITPETAPTLYTPYQKAQYEPVQLKMIPYYAWANRGENEMMVWFPY